MAKVGMIEDIEDGRTSLMVKVLGRKRQNRRMVLQLIGWASHRFGNNQLVVKGQVVNEVLTHYPLNKEAPDSVTEVGRRHHPATPP